MFKAMDCMCCASMSMQLSVVPSDECVTNVCCLFQAVSVCLSASLWVCHAAVLDDQL